MTRVFILLIVWMIQASVVLLLTRASWIDAQCASERRSVAQLYGERSERDLADRAHQLYQQWFVVTGAVEASYVHLMPVQSRDQHGMDNLAPWFFRWLKSRLDGLWQLLEQALYRIQAALLWWKEFTALTLASLTDGYVTRRIKREAHMAPSADRYTLFMRLMFVGLFVGLVATTIPVAIHPLTIPMCLAVIALSIRFVASNAQQQL